MVKLNEKYTSLSLIQGFMIFNKNWASHSPSLPLLFGFFLITTPIAFHLWRTRAFSGSTDSMGKVSLGSLVPLLTSPSCGVYYSARRLESAFPSPKGVGGNKYCTVWFWQSAWFIFRWRQVNLSSKAVSSFTSVMQFILKHSVTKPGIV